MRRKKKRIIINEIEVNEITEKEIEKIKTIKNNKTSDENEIIVQRIETIENNKRIKTIDENEIMTQKNERVKANDEIWIEITDENKMKIKIALKKTLKVVINEKIHENEKILLNHLEIHERVENENNQLIKALKCEEIKELLLSSLHQWNNKIANQHQIDEIIFHLKMLHIKIILQDDLRNQLNDEKLKNE
jgi:hypothetical protein